MNRYAAIPWPLAGIVVALVLVAIDLLVTSLGPNPALEQTVYRTVMWSIGLASLALLLLPSRRRTAYFLGFVVCALLMAFALYLQYAMDLEPCPLCVFQRVALIVTGLVFLVAALHNPARGGAAFYGVLTLIAAGVGAGLAAWQVWIQGQPKGSVPSCGMGLDYMLDTMPLFDVIARVLKGSGECAEQGWVFLGLAIPSWTFVFFVAMIAAALALIRRD
jgi:disulfide bond formation protein DsbB